MGNQITIGSRVVDSESVPLIVPEIGINHEGSLEVAKLMVDAAASAGAEIVKHQTHVVEDEMSPEARHIVPVNADVSIYEIMERCALNEDDEAELKRYAEEKGLIYLSTPFSRAAALRLERLGVDAYKIGSGECNNYPLIDLVASFGKPMIVSTGMNTIESIAPSVEIMEAHGVDYCLLHCTNLYPTPPSLVRLNAMLELGQAFPNAVVGLSDHCADNYPALAAIALGARIIERHFTDSKERPGPDIAASMDPADLASLIEGAGQIHQALGGSKGPLPEEQVTMDFAFATVVTIAPIAAGSELSHDNLWVKRPGTGEFSAAEYTGLLGRRVSVDLPAGVHLKREHLKA